MNITNSNNYEQDENNTGRLTSIDITKGSGQDDKRRVVLNLDEDVIALLIAIGPERRQKYESWFSATKKRFEDVLKKLEQEAIRYNFVPAHRPTLPVREEDIEDDTVLPDRDGYQPYSCGFIR